MKFLIVLAFAGVLGAQTYPDLSSLTWLQPEGATLTQQLGAGGDPGIIAADQLAINSAQSTVSASQSAVLAAQSALAAAQANLSAVQVVLASAQHQLAIDSAGSATGPPVLYFPNSGNKHEHMLMRSLPPPPYTAILGVSINQPDFSKQVSATLMLRNSVLDKAVLVVDENEMAVVGFNARCCKFVAGTHLSQTLGVDADANSANLFVAYGRIPAPRNWVKIVDDGFHRTFYSSQSDGLAWNFEYQEASGAFTIPDQVGIAGYTLEGPSFLGFYLTVWQFSVTTP